MMKVQVTLTFDNDSYKGYLKALQSGVLPDDLVSLWANRAAKDWTAKVKDDFMAQLKGHMDSYLTSTPEVAAQVDSMVVAIGKTLKEGADAIAAEIVK